MLNDTYKLMASVTVVRELYDADKGIYDVLAEFINEVITRRNLYSFRVEDMTQVLNDDYSFQLSQSVVKTCLKRMGFHSSNGTYLCEDIDKRFSSVNEHFEESEEKNDKLFEDLIEFIENRMDKKLEEDKKRNIKITFCDFLLQDSIDSRDTYMQYFQEFILTLEDDAEKMDILRNVKEGMLLYEGIRYSSNINEIGTWKSKLNLILDTEILFAVGGYNSSLYQDMYQELNKYIKGINKSCAINAPYIKLSYLAETKKEIDSYFERAERIVQGLDCLDPTKEAMSQIVNSCGTRSEVEQKRALFYSKLRESNIFVVNYDFYDLSNSNNKAYNLEQKELCGKYAQKWKESEENIYKSMQSLSHINILRKAQSDRGFENCGYIFLTATGRTLKLAFASDFLKEGEVPLATTFDFLINRFWFKLNKGFGSNRTPRTIDMIMRAKHVLSAIVSSKISEIFDDYKKKYERDEISKEQFFDINNGLRSKLKLPEEVDKDTIGFEIDSLEQWDFEEIIREQNKKEQELNRAMNQINSLKTDIEQSKISEKKMMNQIKDLQTKLSSLQSRSDEDRHRMMTEIDKERKEKQEREENIKKLELQLSEEKKKQEIAENNKKLHRFYCIVGLITFLVILGVGFFIYGTVTEKIWAKVISCFLECSAVFSIVISCVKKIKPKPTTQLKEKI